MAHGPLISFPKNKYAPRHAIFANKGGLFHVEHVHFVFGQDCLCEIGLKLRFSWAWGPRCARHAARFEDLGPRLTPATRAARLYFPVLFHWFFHIFTEYFSPFHLLSITP